MTEALKKGFENEINLDSLQVKTDSVGIDVAKKALKNNQHYTGMSDEEVQAIDSVLTLEQKFTGSSFNLKQKELDSLITLNAPQAEKLKAMGLREDAGAFTKRIYTQLLKFYEQQGGGILKALYDIIPIAMFLLLPLFAMLLKLFYWKRGTFAHHMVFSFYFFTFLFTAFSVLIIANKIINIPIWIEVLYWLSFIFYLMLALRNFYKSRWVGAFFKANTIAFMYMLFVLPIAIVGIIFVSFMLY